MARFASSPPLSVPPAMPAAVPIRARHERGDDDRCRDGGPRQAIAANPRRPPRCVLLRQLVADALPYFEAVLLAARRRVGRRDHGERRRDLLICRGARRARSEVGIDVLAAPRLAVVVERQFFFGEMAVHGWLPADRSAESLALPGGRR